MNIDLLMTDRGQAGLLCDDDFVSPVAGVLFDAESRFLTVEFADMDSIELNIPVEEEYIQPILYSQSLQVGTMKKGIITASHQVPVLFLNDPFGENDAPPQKASNSVLQFESFLKRCISGQPIHRDDPGDEANMNSVMNGANASALQFAPQLVRQRTMEATPKAPAPKGPAPSGPGGMGGSQGGTAMRPRTNNENDDDRHE